MSEENNVLIGGNDDAIQRTRQFINVYQSNNSNVYVDQDADQDADQEEEIKA